MKREILFRGLRVDNSKLAFGTGITDFLNVCPEKRGLWLWADAEYFGGIGKEWVPVFPDSVGQFTGKRDVKEKGIFVGDLVLAEIETILGSEQHKGWVEDSDECGFIVMFGDIGVSISIYDESLKWLIVVNNIHDKKAGEQ